MRLYLSSEFLGERAGALLAMLTGRRVAVVANGYDGRSAAARQIYRNEVHDPVAAFAALGLAAEPLDLRAHFGDAESLRRRLEAYHLVWVMGGNAFVLRRAMRQSGFDRVVAPLLEADAIAYGGYGAGAVVAGPTLRGMELMDDPWELPDGYDDGPVLWHGLGLTPFAIIPHHRSRHPDAAAADKIVSYMHARKARFRAIADGEVIIRAGNFERLAS